MNNLINHKARSTWYMKRKISITAVWTKKFLCPSEHFTAFCCRKFCSVFKHVMCAKLSTSEEKLFLATSQFIFTTLGHVTRNELLLSKLHVHTIPCSFQDDWQTHLTFTCIIIQIWSTRWTWIKASKIKLYTCIMCLLASEILIRYFSRYTWIFLSIMNWSKIWR